MHEQTDGQEKGDECSEMNAGHINLFEQGWTGAGAGGAAKMVCGLVCKLP